MSMTPIQYGEMAATSGSNACAYEGTPGPKDAGEAGDYKKNTQGLRQIKFILTDFKRPEIRPIQW